MVVLPHPESFHGQSSRDSVPAFCHAIIKISNRFSSMPGLEQPASGSPRLQHTVCRRGHPLAGGGQAPAFITQRTSQVGVTWVIPPTRSICEPGDTHSALRTGSLAMVAVETISACLTAVGRSWAATISTGISRISLTSNSACSWRLAQTCHDRVRYRREGVGWVKERLAP